MPEAGYGAAQQFDAIANSAGRATEAVVTMAERFAAITVVAGSLGGAVKSFAELQQTLVLTNSVAQGTTKQLEEMDAAVRKLALGFQITAKAGSEALYSLASAGFTVKESVEALSGVTLLAQGTLTGLSQVADTVANTLSVFNLKASDSSRVANVFAAAMSQSQATFEKLSFALRYVGPVAAELNLKLEDTVAVLDLLQDAGQRGQQSGTGFREVLIKLINPSKEAAEIMGKIGLNIRDSEGKVRNFIDIMKDLQKLDLSSISLSKIFEVRGLGSAETILKGLDVEAFRARLYDASGALTEFGTRVQSVATAAGKNINQITNAFEYQVAAITNTQYATRLALDQATTLSAAFGRAKNAATEFGFALGGQLAGPIGALSNMMTSAANAFRSFDDRTKELITGIPIVVGVIYGLVRALQGVFSLSTSIAASGNILGVGGLIQSARNFGNVAVGGVPAGQQNPITQGGATGQGAAPGLTSTIALMNRSMDHLGTELEELRSVIHAEQEDVIQLVNQLRSTLPYLARVEVALESVRAQDYALAVDIVRLINVLAPLAIVIGENRLATSNSALVNRDLQRDTVVLINTQRHNTEAIIANITAVDQLAIAIRGLQVHMINASALGGGVPPTGGGTPTQFGNIVQRTGPSGQTYLADVNTGRRVSNEAAFAAGFPRAPNPATVNNPAQAIPTITPPIGPTPINAPQPYAPTQAQPLVSNSNINTFIPATVTQAISSPVVQQTAQTATAAATATLTTAGFLTRLFGIASLGVGVYSIGVIVAAMVPYIKNFLTDTIWRPAGKSSVSEKDLGGDFQTQLAAIQSLSEPSYSKYEKTQVALAGQSEKIGFEHGTLEVTQKDYDDLKGRINALQEQIYQQASSKPVPAGRAKVLTTFEGTAVQLGGGDVDPALKKELERLVAQAKNDESTIYQIKKNIKSAEEIADRGTEYVAALTREKDFVSGAVAADTAVKDKAAEAKQGRTVLILEWLEGLEKNTRQNQIAAQKALQTLKQDPVGDYILEIKELQLESINKFINASQEIKNKFDKEFATSFQVKDSNVLAQDQIGKALSGENFFLNKEEQQGIISRIKSGESTASIRAFIAERDKAIAESVSGNTDPAIKDTLARLQASSTGTFLAMLNSIDYSQNAKIPILLDKFKQNKEFETKLRDQLQDYQNEFFNNLFQEGGSNVFGLQLQAQMNSLQKKQEDQVKNVISERSALLTKLGFFGSDEQTRAKITAQADRQDQLLYSAINRATVQSARNIITANKVGQENALAELKNAVNQADVTKSQIAQDTIALLGFIGFRAPQSIIEEASLQSIKESRAQFEAQISQMEREIRDIDIKRNAIKESVKALKEGTNTPELKLPLELVGGTPAQIEEAMQRGVESLDVKITKTTDDFNAKFQKTLADFLGKAEPIFNPITKAIETATTTITTTTTSGGKLRVGSDVGGISFDPDKPIVISTGTGSIVGRPGEKIMGVTTNDGLSTSNFNDRFTGEKLPGGLQVPAIPEDLKQRMIKQSIDADEELRKKKEITQTNLTQTRVNEAISTQKYTIEEKKLIEAFNAEGRALQERNKVIQVSDSFYEGMQFAARKAMHDVTSNAQLAVQVYQQVSTSIADGIANFLVKGQKDWRVALSNLVRDIDAMIIKAQVMKVLAAAGSGFASPTMPVAMTATPGAEGAVGVSGANGPFVTPTFSALGNVFGRNGLIPFAMGGLPDILTKPTFFPMGGGRVGVGGERSDEAIVPLKRNSRGELGIAAPRDSFDNSNQQQSSTHVTVNQNIMTPNPTAFHASRSTMAARAHASFSRHVMRTS